MKTVSSIYNNLSFSQLIFLYGILIFIVFNKVIRFKYRMWRFNWYEYAKILSNGPRQKSINLNRQCTPLKVIKTDQNRWLPVKITYIIGLIFLHFGNPEHPQNCLP